MTAPANIRRPRNGWWSSRVLILMIACACFAGALFAQAGRRAHPTSEAATALNVVAVRTDGAASPITSKEVSLFDNGVEQTIRNFAPDLSAAKIVLLVDNSLTIRADVEKLEAAAQEFAYEIFDGDKLLIVGYDSEADIVSDWTDNAKKIEAELKAFHKKGDPRLFDAIMAVVGDALQPLSAQKGAVVGSSGSPGCGRKEKILQKSWRPLWPVIGVFSVAAEEWT